MLHLGHIVLSLLLFKMCFYLFLATLGLRCFVSAFSGFSERGLLFTSVHRLLIAVASLVAEHRLWSAGLVVARGLSCSSAGGISPDQRSNPHPLHWQLGSYPLRTTREVHSLSLKNRFRFAIHGPLNCSQLCVIFEMYIDCR